jgi:hypothetical protein
MLIPTVRRHREYVQQLSRMDMLDYVRLADLWLLMTLSILWLLLAMPFHHNQASSSWWQVF